MLDITFEQIRAFLAVAKYGNFSAAAEKIFRTQAALSIQVARLEELTGTRLFNRTTKRVEITEAGCILKRYLQQVEQALEQAAAELDDLQQVKQGRLVISTSDTTACYRLPRILQEYNREFPGVELIIRNATSPRTRQLVLDNAVDLGIITLAGIPAELEALPLFPRYDVVICHPGHELAGRQEVFLKDLEVYTCILLDENCATRQILDRVCRASRINLNISMELSSVEVIKRFVRINSGISIVPGAAVRDEIAAGQLIALGIQEYKRLEPVQMGVVYKKKRYLSAAAGSFLERLSRLGKV